MSSCCDRCFHNRVCKYRREGVFIPDCRDYHRDFELGTSQEQCMKVLRFIRSHCMTHLCQNCQFRSWCFQVDGTLPKDWSLYRIKQIGNFKEVDNG